MTAPCDVDLRGRVTTEWCPDAKCGHVLAFHRQTGICSLCERLDISCGATPTPKEGRPLTASELPTILRDLFADGRVSTHYSGCFANHKGCAALFAADRIDALTRERDGWERAFRECERQLAAAKKLLA